MKKKLDENMDVDTCTPPQARASSPQLAPWVALYHARVVSDSESLMNSMDDLVEQASQGIFGLALLIKQTFR